MNMWMAQLCSFWRCYRCKHGKERNKWILSDTDEDKKARKSNYAQRKANKLTKGSFPWLSHNQFARSNRSSRPTGSSPCTFPINCITPVIQQISHMNNYSMYAPLKRQLFIIAAFAQDNSKSHKCFSSGGSCRKTNSLACSTLGNQWATDTNAHLVFLSSPISNILLCCGF